MSIMLTSYNVKGRCRDADGQVRRLYKDTFRKHLYFVFYKMVRYYEHYRILISQKKLWKGNVEILMDR